MVVQIYLSFASILLPLPRCENVLILKHQEALLESNFPPPFLKEFNYICIYHFMPT